MRTLIQGVRVFDGERTTARADVVIEDDLIVAVGGDPHAAVDVEIDGAERTLLPGLIDAHTHVFDGSLAQALRYGVTTELDMFCLPSVLTEQRRLAAESDHVADLRSAGTLATAPGGHPTQLLGALSGSALDSLDQVAIDFVSDPAQASDFVAGRLAEGADYLKIVIDDGSVHGASLPVMTPQTVAALADAAHEAGLRVIAHAITAAEVRIALEAGVDGLAHVWSDIAPGDPATAVLAEQVRERGVFVVTTLAYFEALTAQRTGGCARPGSCANAAADAVRALHRAGVPLLAGTDATPFVPAHGTGMHRELRLLTEAGLTAEEVLAAATSGPARHFALGDRGRVAAGMRADLLLVNGDPTRDIAAVGDIAEVWRRGVRQAGRDS
ncbi:MULTISPECIES: amidohydrolase family protein [Nocardia]|uniref:amidohydrolase family protein n=1 Tax=Nocardia abscessus TaxID=120957 RepID=UPI0018940E5C|nr:amidohydrolase family protein [Nocardia abscessus]MBF6475489.1 amidohydrolase family protein [Nocardia abscessus]